MIAAILFPLSILTAFCLALKLAGWADDETGRR